MIDNWRYENTGRKIVFLLACILGAVAILSALAACWVDGDLQGRLAGTSLVSWFSAAMLAIICSEMD